MLFAAVSSRKPKAAALRPRHHVHRPRQRTASIASYRLKAAQARREWPATCPGWPADDCLKMDKGSHGLHRVRTSTGPGGYGNELTVGEAGDVIWQAVRLAAATYLHARVNDWIYATMADDGGGDV